MAISRKQILEEQKAAEERAAAVKAEQEAAAKAAQEKLRMIPERIMTVLGSKPEDVFEATDIFKALEPETSAMKSSGSFVEATLGVVALMAVWAPYYLALEKLVADGRIMTVVHSGKTYYGVKL